MNEMYAKNQLSFFCFWMIGYMVVQDVGSVLSRAVGIAFSATALLNLGLSVYLMGWVKQNGLMERYGLCRVKVPWKHLLWFLPLLAVSTGNLWNGAAWNLPPAETICFVVGLACVGFLEELLVRGVLFQYCKERRGTGFAVGSTTLFFGAVHLINLFSAHGPTLTENLLQVAGALSFGLLWSVVRLRSGSLWPCILSHGLMDVLSVFAREEGMTPAYTQWMLGISILIVLLYVAFLVAAPGQKNA